jgi:hypothetical protein
MGKRRRIRIPTCRLEAFIERSEPVNGPDKPDWGAAAHDEKQSDHAAECGISPKEIKANSPHFWTAVLKSVGDRHKLRELQNVVTSFGGVQGNTFHLP